MKCYGAGRTGRTEIFLASVDKIVKWMYKSNTDPNVVKLVED